MLRKRTRDGDSQRKSLSERVANHLREAIVTGAYPKDGFLPPVRQLAREFGVAVRTVVDAVAVLSAEGMLEPTRGRGTRVLSPMSWAKGGRVAVIRKNPAYINSSVAWREQEWLTEGAEAALERLGYPYDLHELQPEGWPRVSEIPARRRIVPDQIAALAADYRGIIAMEATGCEAPLLELDALGFPVVVANRESDVELTATCVDHAGMMRQAVLLLAALGHTRLVLLRRETNMQYYVHAMAGFWKGVEECGLSRETCSVFMCSITSSDLAFGGYDAMREMLAQSPPPTGVICTRDYLAGGVCRAVTEAGLELGRDVSVIGYDNLSWHEDPPVLTTFSEPCHEMGAKAVELLVDRMMNGWRPPTQHAIPAPLIIRGSVGPPAVRGPDAQARPHVALAFTDYPPRR